MNYLFVSDLHLDAAAPRATDQFIAVLRGPARTAQALYILGDLFEVWIGDDDAEPERQRVCEALREYTAAGIPAFVMHGNRDFLLGAQFSVRSGCVLLPDPVVTSFDGVRCVLTHGDLLCTDDAAYQELRSLVRDARWRRRFLALPAAQRLQLADAARAGSRTHTGRTAAQIMDVNAQAVMALMRATGAQLLIHGHTHRPGLHELRVDTRACQRVVLDAWYEHGNLLWMRGGIPTLTTLPR